MISIVTQTHTHTKVSGVSLATTMCMQSSLSRGHMIYCNVDIFFIRQLRVRLFTVYANLLDSFMKCAFSFLGDINDDNKAARVHHTHMIVCVMYILLIFVRNERIQAKTETSEKTKIITSAVDVNKMTSPTITM